MVIGAANEDGGGGMDVFEGGTTVVFKDEGVEVDTLGDVEVLEEDVDNLDLDCVLPGSAQVD